MPMTRNKEFYDLLAIGLRDYSYTDLKSYLDDMFAEKYNADSFYDNLGFPLNPNIPIRPTYEQIEVTVRPYTMATHVDIDSDGPTKSTDGMALSMGQIPIWKHEFTIGRKELREQMYLADRIGRVTPEIVDVAMEQMFITADKLLGGNYNTMAYNRHQIVSNGGKLIINAQNSHLGIPLSLDFGVPSKNFTTKQWFTKNATTGDITEKSGITPIKDMKEIRKNARRKDNMPSAGHWEVSDTTWEDALSLEYFRKQYALAKRPDIESDANRLAWAETIPDADIKAYIEEQIGAPIVVVDHIGFVEKFDPKTKKMEYIECPSFKEGVFVYVPDGAIGDTQFGKPIYMETPGARNALYDGGRTLIRQVFNDENMIQTIKSEFTGLPVPNQTRWMYYLTVQG